MRKEPKVGENCGTLPSHPDAEPKTDVRDLPGSIISISYH